MRRLSFTVIAVSAAITLASVGAFAQAPAPAAPPPAPLPPIGGLITLDQAKMVAAAAEAEAKKNNWNYAIAIVEPNGALVYFQKMGGTMYGSINVAMDKAASAALYRRPTAAFDAGLRAGGTYLLTLRGVNAVPGGLPIVIDGKLVGAIGASGGSGPEDAQVAQAGIAGLK
jgi:glc operon protein GlcG